MVLNDKDLDKWRPPTGTTAVISSTEDRVAYAEWLRSLTVLERLELSRDGWVSSRPFAPQAMPQADALKIVEAWAANQTPGGPPR